jgi:hypothetical protein
MGSCVLGQDRHRTHEKDFGDTSIVLDCFPTATHDITEKKIMNRVPVYSGLCKGKEKRDKELFFVRNQEDYDALAEKVAFTVAEQEDVYFESMRVTREAERQERIRKMEHDETMARVDLEKARIDLEKARIDLEKEKARIAADLEKEKAIHAEVMRILQATDVVLPEERFQLLLAALNRRHEQKPLKRTFSN